MFASIFFLFSRWPNIAAIFEENFFIEKYEVDSYHYI